MSGVGRVLACVVVVIILHVLKSLFIDIPMGWKHRGGAIPMAIFVGVCVWCVIKTWKGLGKKENKPTEQPINTKSSQDIFYIPPEQAIKCPECGRDILKSSSYCHYCKYFISRDSVNDREQPAKNTEKNINTAVTIVNNQKKQNVVLLSPNALIGEEILAEFKELVDLSPRAAAMALENSPIGECLRKRLREYGACSAMDRADIFLLLKKLNLEEQNR